MDAMLCYCCEGTLCTMSWTTCSVNYYQCRHCSCADKKVVLRFIKEHVLRQVDSTTAQYHIDIDETFLVSFNLLPTSKKIGGTLSHAGWLISIPCSFKSLCHCSSIFIAPTLSHGVLQWLSTSSHCPVLWTLTMAVSRTTGAVATSWSQRGSCPLRGTLMPPAANTDVAPPSCCSRYN